MARLCCTFSFLVNVTLSAGSPTAAPQLLLRVCLYVNMGWNLVKDSQS